MKVELPDADGLSGYNQKFIKTLLQIPTKNKHGLTCALRRGYRGFWATCPGCLELNQKCEEEGHSFTPPSLLMKILNFIIIDSYNPRCDNCGERAFSEGM